MRLMQQREGRGAAHAAWARAVKDRDGWRCRICGATRGLVAHHVRPWATFSALRYDLDNGETLCNTCHARMHPTMRARTRIRRVAVWKLIGGFLAFYTAWFWLAPRDIALRPTRAALAYIVLLLVLRVVRRLRR